MAKCIGRVLTRLARKCQVAVGLALQQYDLTAAEEPFLMHILLREGCTQEELTARVGVDKAATARAVRSLEEKGFLTRMQDPRDKRQNRVYPTDKARETGPLVKAELARINQSLAQSLSPAEEAWIYTMLAQIDQNFKPEGGAAVAEFYTRFIQETFDENGRLTDCSYVYDEDFNYGYDVIDPLGTLYPDKLAMLWRNDRGKRTRLTFGQVKDLSTQAANLFASRGIGKGDVILAALRTHWEYWIVAVAAHKLGAILSPLYYRLTTEDFAYRMQKAQAKAVVVCREGETAEYVLAAARQTGVDLRFSIDGAAPGFEDFHQCLAEQPTQMARVETRWDEPILVYFTSGSTGEPKAVLHDHAYTLACHYGSRYMQDVHDGSLHFATGDTGWEVVAGTKFYGQWLHLGALLVYDYDRFPAEQVLACLAQEKVTGIMAQPTVYRMLTEVGMDKYDLSSLTNLAVGGEKLSPDLARKVTEQTGLVLHEGYAQSECGLIAAVSKNMGRKEGAVGKVMPKFHVEILLEDGAFAPPGQEGEIVIVADGGRRPEGIMMGYLNDPEATENLWDGDIFHTGDLAVMDEEGYLFYRGRADGIIKTKGYRVSPVELEHTLVMHPAVKECLVVGLPDEALGQKITAYVVPEKDYFPGDDLKADLMAFHNQRVAGFKKLRDLFFVHGLARNANGKVIRNQFHEKA